MESGGKRLYICLPLGIAVPAFVASSLLLLRGGDLPGEDREPAGEAAAPAVVASADPHRRAPAAGMPGSPSAVLPEAPRAGQRSAPVTPRGPLPVALPGPPPRAAVPPPPSRVRGRVVQTSGAPVARAEVSLWGCTSDGTVPVRLAQGTTDWQGHFDFEEVRPARDARIRVQALYYVGFEGPSFLIPPGDDLDLCTVILSFGGSLQGEVLDGEGRRRVPHAEVLLIPRFLEEGAARKTRTDSKGTFLFSGIEPGEYALEVHLAGAAVSSARALFIKADSPTLKVHLHLDGDSLEVPPKQDPQQFRVYRTERIVSTGARRFGSVEEIQDYVDGMIASRWWEKSFPRVRAIQVRWGADEDLARGGANGLHGGTAEIEPWVSGHIELPRWGWDELTALHEVAHVLSNEGDHGPLFVRNFLALVQVMLGEAPAFELSQAYAAEGVAF